ncbi:MAG: hypothetical protein WBL19_00420 [Minisyncoccia bacterium]
MNIKAQFVDRDPAPKKPTAEATEAPSCAARNLALAYKIEALIDRGLVRDYTAAATMLNLSQVRVTHLASLRLLCPDIQTAILLGELEFGDKELRVLTRILDWDKQKAWVAARTASPRRRTPAGWPAKT